MDEKCKKADWCGRDVDHLGPCLSIDFLKGVREGVAAMKEGQVTSWEEAKRDLGLED